MDTRDGEIANRNKIPSRRSNESQVHFRFVEHWLVLDAWIINPGTMSILIAILEPLKRIPSAVSLNLGRHGGPSQNHSRFGRRRSPKIAVPTRTSVAPSSIATVKSF